MLRFWKSTFYDNYIWAHGAYLYVAICLHLQAAARWSLTARLKRLRVRDDGWNAAGYPGSHETMHVTVKLVLPSLSPVIHAFLLLVPYHDTSSQACTPNR